MKKRMKHLALIVIVLMAGSTLLGGGQALADGPNLIANGDFEQPVVIRSQKWNIFPSGDVNWSVEWLDGYPCAENRGQPDSPMLELHKGVNGWLPQNGDQHAELDTDCDGNGGMDGQNTSVRIWQEVSAIAGAEYTLTYYWSPRPNHNDNELSVEVNGAEVASHSGSGSSNTSWQEETYTFTAEGETVTIAFLETGDPDSFGMFLDNVSLVQASPEEVNNILECVIDNGDGTYTAFFGYENPNPFPVEVPVGPDNYMTGGGLSPEELEAATPTQFGVPNIFPDRPGRSDYWPNAAFSIIFDGSNLVWNLFGHTETASSNPGQRCKYHISFDKEWLGSDGLPAGLVQGPDGFKIVAISEMGQVTCHYENEVLNCDNNNDLLVLSGETYFVQEFNLPTPWEPKSGAGVDQAVEFDVGEYAECDGKFCTHTVINKEHPTAISLVSFTAQAGAGSVTLAWETGAEISNAGFNLYRAASPNGPWTQINDALIAAQGDPVAGASYTFTDTPGYGTFYYQLEDVDYFGVSTLHGPVSVKLGSALRLPWFRPALPAF
jgi:hypothetical protein